MPEPIRIPLAHSVRYAVRGLPEVPNKYGDGVLAPSEITLTYRAAPDSQLGRVHAYVAGRLWVNGAEIPLLPGGLYGQHYDEGLDGWPDWLVEEARLHDPEPTAQPPANRAPRGLTRDLLAGWLALHTDDLTAALKASPDVEPTDVLARHKQDLLTDPERKEVRLLLDTMLAELADEPDAQSPAARAALRDRIAEALYERERPPLDKHWPDVYASDRETFGAMADAVLAGLPELADRAAEMDRLRTETERMRHELEVMYGGAFDDLEPEPADRASLLLDAETAARTEADRLETAGYLEAARGARLVADLLRRKA